LELRLGAEEAAQVIDSTLGGELVTLARALWQPGHRVARATIVVAGTCSPGPAPISPRQQAQAISDALGTPLQFVEQSRAEARADMVRRLPASVVDSTLAILGSLTSAEQQVSPALEEILGRSPGTFVQWAERHVPAFR
jgi:hypothetical protein